MRIGAILMCLFLGACVGHNHAPVQDLERPKTQRWGTHKVVKGDTLYSIAWRYGQDYRDLAAANGIEPPYLLQPEQVLYLGRAPVKKAAATTTTKKAASAKASVKQSTSAPPMKMEVAGPVQWRWPVQGKLISKFSNWQGNKGIDIGANAGAPVAAAANGVVVYAGAGLIGYGNLIIIKHNHQYLSAYAHNRRMLVKEKDSVKVGDKIAEIGSTGSHKPMLHFQIRKDGQPVDPLKYLPKAS